MSKYCPLVGEKVLYTECIECEEKACKNNVDKHNNKVNNDDDRRNDGGSKEKQRIGRKVSVP